MSVARHNCMLGEDKDLRCLQIEEKLWLVAVSSTCSCDIKDYVTSEQWECCCIRDWIVNYCPSCGYKLDSLKKGENDVSGDTDTPEQVSTTFVSGSYS